MVNLKLLVLLVFKSSHPWEMAYWPLSAGWPFNTGLTNLRVIQDNGDLARLQGLKERVKYLHQTDKRQTDLNRTSKCPTLPLLVPKERMEVKNYYWAPCINAQCFC